MLDYVALGLLAFIALTFVYGIVFIHDIPYRIARSRNHPHADAIHVAGWVSLLTLHVIWPFLWIWATLYRPERGYGFSGVDPRRIETLEAEVRALRAAQQRRDPGEG